MTSADYVPIYLDTLRIDAVLDFDLFLEQGFEYILYRSANLPFTEKIRCALLDHSISKLFISTESRKTYQNYLESNLSSIVKDTSIKESVRAGILYDSAKYLIKDLFAKPTLGENIKRGQELVESTIGFILLGQAAFSSLLRVMSFDYSTYTHSVNVCTLSLALAQFIGVKNPKKLRTLGTGALLHDIGKTRVPESILNKAGVLTSEEMDLVKNHPNWGQDLVRKTDLLEPEAYFPIIQHHERENSTGYPYATSSNEIHLYGKITAVADVFDAMTTERAYRSAIDAYPALTIMFDDEGAFDNNLLKKLAEMLSPSGLTKA